MTKAKVFRSQDMCMTGGELKRLREAAKLTQEQLGAAMNGWGWYRDKVYRYEESEHFCLNPYEMRALLKVLRASN